MNLIIMDGSSTHASISDHSLSLIMHMYVPSLKHKDFILAILLQNKPSDQLTLICTDRCSRAPVIKALSTD